MVVAGAAGYDGVMVYMASYVSGTVAFASHVSEPSPALSVHGHGATTAAGVYEDEHSTEAAVTSSV